MGKKDVGMYNNLIYISQIGIMMVTPILGGVYIGNYLEGYFHNKLAFFLCLIIGIMSSFYELYRFSMKYIERMKKRRK